MTFQLIHHRSNARTATKWFDPLSPVPVYIGLSFLNFIISYLWLLMRPGSTLPLGLTWEAINKALFFFSAYSFFWMFGYFIGNLRYRRKRVHSWVSRRASVSSGAVALVFALFLAAVFAMYQATPNGTDGPRSMLTTGLYGHVFFLTVAGLVAAYMFWASATLDSLAAARRPGRVKRNPKWLSIVTLLSGAVAFFLVIGLLKGRTRALYGVLALIIIVHYCVRRFSFFEISCLVVGLLGIALGMGGYLVGDNDGLMMKLFGLEGGRNFDSLYNLAVLLDRFPAGHDYYYGSTILNSVLGDLGYGAGLDSREFFLTQIYHFHDYVSSYPISQPGDLFINFGVLGMVFAAGFGYISRSSYFYFIEGRVLGVAGVPCYIIILLQSSFVSPAGYVFGALVLCLAKLWWLAIFFVFLGGGSRTIVLKSEPRF